MKATSKKVYMDLSINKLKTAFILTTLLFTNIVFGIVIMISQTLTPEIRKEYFKAAPAEVIIKCSAYQRDILDQLKKIPEIEEIKGGTTLSAQLVDNSKKYNMNLIVLDESNRVNILKNKDGTNSIPTLQKNEIFIERAAEGELGKLPGEAIDIIIENQISSQLILNDYVYDASTEPFTLEGDVCAYITPDTCKNLTGDDSFHEIYFTVKGDKSKSYNETICNKAVQMLTSAGLTVYETEVVKPDSFYASFALQAINLILSVLGILIIVMACSLIINIYNSMMLQQVKIIGIMKSYGGSALQIGRMYYANIILIGLFTYLLSVPVSYLAAKFICNKLASFLNISLQRAGIPFFLPIIIFICTLIIPAIAVSVPILKASRATVYDSMNSNIKGGAYKHSGALNRLISSLHSLSMLSRYAIRNQMKDRLRSILTIAGLVLSCCILMTSLNLQTSLNRTINSYRSLFPDIILTMDNLYDANKMKSLITDIDEIKQAECWAFQAALYVEKDGISTKKVLLEGAPESSSLFDKKAYAAKLQSGRLLSNDNTNQIVISNHLLSFYPDIKLGDTITIKINQVNYDFTIVGILSMFGQPESPSLFVNYSYLNQILGGKDMVRDMRLQTVDLSEEELSVLINKVEAALNKAGIQVREINTGADKFEEFSLSANLVIALLIVLSIFMLIVGTIGLAGSLNISVMERTSEFGIMRAVGGSHKQINGFILLEGMILTGAAWIIGNLLSIPITYALSGLLGNVLFDTPASFQLNLPGMAIGVVIAFAMTFLSCRIPCMNLCKLSTRDMLVYE